LGKPRTNDRKTAEGSRKEDGTPSSEVVVERVRYPTAAEECVSRQNQLQKGGLNSQERGSNVWARIDYPYNPLIRLGIWVWLSSSSSRVFVWKGFSIPDIKCQREREVGAVGTSLIPAPITVKSRRNTGTPAVLLNGSTD
jgi:hypothetical protein